MVEILSPLPIWIFVAVALTACAAILALCYSGLELQFGKHVWLRIPGLRPGPRHRCETSTGPIDQSSDPDQTPQKPEPAPAE